MRPPGSENIAGLGLEQVARDAPVAIAVIDVSGHVVYSNGRAQELTSRQLGTEMPADIDGAIDVFHPDGRRYERHELPAVRSITSGEEIVDEEFFYLLADGSRLSIRCSSSPVRNADGEIVAAVLAQADVTARKAQERRLTYVDGLPDSTEDAIVAFDSQWFVTVWNAGAERLYGRTADETLDRHTLRTTVRLGVPLDARRKPKDSTRILLVDDHASIREALAAMLEREPDLEVSAQAASLAEARGLLEDVDVALIDLGLPDGSGIDLIKDLQETSPRAQALVLSASVDRLETARAVQAGAAAVLSKTAHLDEVVDAVRRLRAGETLLPLDEVVGLLRFAGERRRQEHEASQALERLTRRELDVLQALADGLDSQAVADRLFITLHTVRNHVANILAKLGVHSQLQALVFALRHGVVELR
ncbi:MAG TPA: response regulator [Solirubrobacteraceae bacterium]|nr:response regulator [Solirubrobacteraceae bacterium]